MASSDSDATRLAFRNMEIFFVCGVGGSLGLFRKILFMKGISLLLGRDFPDFLTLSDL